MSLRSNKGGLLAECAAAMVIFVPVLVVVIFVALEASGAYLLKSSMSEAAREAAHDLAIAYGTNPSIAGNRALQDAAVFDKIRYPNAVADSRQFNDPVWNATADPPVVGVTVRYTSSQYGLPKFPNPDPLNMGASLQIVGNATYRLR